MLQDTRYMNIKDYIYKLQQRPAREREWIAVVWTAIAFGIVLVIWFVSFRQMNKPAEAPVDQTSADLDDLKNTFNEGRDSIEDMMQQLPSQTMPLGNPAAAPNNDNLNANDRLQSPDNDLGNSQDKPSVPELP